MSGSWQGTTTGLMETVMPVAGYVQGTAMVGLLGLAIYLLVRWHSRRTEETYWRALGAEARYILSRESTNRVQREDLDDEH